MHQSGFIDYHWNHFLKAKRVPQIKPQHPFFVFFYRYNTICLHAAAPSGRKLPPCLHTPRVLPWAMSSCPFRAKESLTQGVRDTDKRRTCTETPYQATLIPTFTLAFELSGIPSLLIFPSRWSMPMKKL